MSALCVIFRQLGPYHWARLNSTGTLMPTVALELFGGTDEYDWYPVRAAGSFRRVTLFPERESHRVTRLDIIDRVQRALNEFQPEIVAIPGWSDRAALAALWWSSERDRHVVVMSESQASDQPRTRVKEAIKKGILSLCSTGLAGGSGAADYLEDLGMSRDRIFIGYDVVDNAYFAQGADAARRNAAQTRLDLDLPENYFLASSRFIKRKNLLRLLNGYDHYRQSAGNSAWKLVMLGDGPQRAELAAYIHEKKLAPDVRLPGFKQYAELPAYYGLARAFVHASTSEPWGLVVNEAMASGLPVLVSDRCGCARDLVVENKNGFSFDPFDVPRLADLLGRFSAGESGLHAMGTVSRRIVADWSPQIFSHSLASAVDLARTAPRPRAAIGSRFLLKTFLRA